LQNWRGAMLTGEAGVNQGCLVRPFGLVLLALCEWLPQDLTVKFFANCPMPRFQEVPPAPCHGNNTKNTIWLPFGRLNTSPKSPWVSGRESLLIVTFNSELLCLSFL
jgi:hypothetical protein